MSQPRRPDEEWPPLPAELVDEGSLDNVVKHLAMRYTRLGALVPRDPSEPGVRWLLEAGVRLLRRQFTAEVEVAAGDALAYAPYNQMMVDIGSKAVLDECRQMFDEIGLKHNLGKANRGRLTNRWKIIAKYHADLLSYVFRPQAAERRVRQLEREVFPHLFTLPFGDLVERLAIAETEVVATDELMQLQLAIELALPNDQRVHALSHALYARQVDYWASVYEAVADRYRIRFLREYSFADMAQLFNAVVEGASARALAGDDLIQISRGRHLTVTIVQLLIEGMTGTPWRTLKDLTPDPPPS